jgi:toxin ParE1/3/4
MGHRRVHRVDADLDEIWYYIAKESGSIETADRFIKSLTDHFSLLAENPYLGRSRDADLRSGVRSFPVGRYIILYRVEDADVVILYVLHGNRNIKALIDENPPA